MTSEEFFCTVDVLDYLKKEAFEAADRVGDMMREVFALVADLEELILCAGRELTDGCGEYIADVRVFAGFEDSAPERTERVKKMLERFSRS